MSVIDLNALSRLGWGRLEGWGKWRSTDSYRNPQFVTANVNGLIVLAQCLIDIPIEVFLGGGFLSGPVRTCILVLTVVKAEDIPHLKIDVVLWRSINEGVIGSLPTNEILPSKMNQCPVVELLAAFDLSKWRESPSAEKCLHVFVRFSGWDYRKQDLLSHAF